MRSLSNLILSICPSHRPLLYGVKHNKEKRLANFEENIINTQLKLTFYLHLVVIILIRVVVLLAFYFNFASFLISVWFFSWIYPNS